MKPFKARLTDLEGSISAGLTVNKVYSFNERGAFRDDDGDLRPCVAQGFATHEEALRWWKTPPFIVKFEPITEPDTLTKEEIRDIIREEIKSYDHTRTIAEHEKQKAIFFRAMSSGNVYAVDTDAVKRAINLRYGTLSGIREYIETKIEEIKESADHYLSKCKSTGMTSITLQSNTDKLISVNITETEKATMIRVISESRGYYSFTIEREMNTKAIEKIINGITEYIGELIND